MRQGTIDDDATDTRHHPLLHATIRERLSPPPRLTVRTSGRSPVLTLELRPSRVTSRHSHRILGDGHSAWPTFATGTPMTQPTELDQAAASRRIFGNADMTANAEFKVIAEALRELVQEIRLVRLHLERVSGSSLDVK
jgi:hypothetical protein